MAMTTDKEADVNIDRFHEAGVCSCWLERRNKEKRCVRELPASWPSGST